MCGIVGAVARRNVVPILIEGLKRLEYAATTRPVLPW
jgi:glucosamine--fructose-6-phosphate aminotransferase (isomerizing)